MDKTKEQIEVELSEVTAQLESQNKKNKTLAESNARLVKYIAELEQTVQKMDELELAMQKMDDKPTVPAVNPVVQVATAIFTQMIVSKSPRSDSDIDTMALHCKGLAQRALKIWVS